MSFLDVLAIIVEVLSWVGLGVGIPLLIAALIVRAADVRWHEVDLGIVEPTPPGSIAIARWFASDELHERELTDEELAGLGDPDSATAYADHSGRLRFERHSAPSRVLWVLSLALLAVGVVALAGAIVLMFVMG
ncbi:hypothetical protein [Agromyces aerolatus]|uniref:hypothetical protein n=1 Tax=Agromyces sp. LY-1074 TaxID=3074080 RepID=UPI00285E8A0F|nr:MULTISPECIES: hypothetical protein [unclassified Agromyces]MDR5701437.1 hypothetical protein [Agromyces sp. LY-1074]MDR5706774.1 hypothetical protein [Agromyces sp. LY-1358]